MQLEFQFCFGFELSPWSSKVIDSEICSFTVALFDFASTNLSHVDLCSTGSSPLYILMKLLINLTLLGAFDTISTVFKGNFLVSGFALTYRPCCCLESETWKSHSF